MEENAAAYLASAVVTSSVEIARLLFPKIMSFTYASNVIIED